MDWSSFLLIKNRVQGVKGSWVPGFNKLKTIPL
jgi:hypothetical protein